MTLKIDIINNAYSQLRISGLTVTPSPNNVATALERLENMMAELESSRNICVDYNFEEVPDPNSPTNVTRPYWHMMNTNLATRLIPDFNKEVPVALLKQASQSLSTASGAVAAQNIRQVQPPRRQPIGSGNNRYGNRYNRFQRPIPLPPNECATHKMVVGDVDDYEEFFIAYLGSETIASFVITADVGLTIQSSSNTDDVVSYRILALDNVTNGVWQQVKIIITTSTGRLETRIINFEITSNITVGSL